MKLNVGLVYPKLKCQRREFLTSSTTQSPGTSYIRLVPGGGTLGLSGWGCAAGTLEPLTYTRASSTKFCYPILE